MMKRHAGFTTACLIVAVIGIMAVSGCSGGAKTGGTSSAPQAANSTAGYASDTAASEESYDYGYAESEAGFDGAYDNAYPASEPMGGGTGEGDFKNAVVMEMRPEKIIQTADIESQTDRFDEVVEKLRAAAPDHGGYVESASQYTHGNRVFNITLRVPTEQFETVRLYVESLAHVIGTTQNAENVTGHYYDLLSRLETKQIEEERVLEMIGRATNIEDLLALEERLGYIRTQIERYQASLNTIDRLAAYSTIRMTLTEVTHEELVITSDDLGGRIRKAFLRSVNGTAVFFQEVILFLAGAFIPLTIIGLLAFVGVRIVLAAYKKTKTKERNT